MTVPFKLSVVVPVYNEERTLAKVLSRLSGISIPGDLEILIVNDGSTDTTRHILKKITDPRMRVIHHEQNSGKGSAVRTGVREATGSHLLIFDADEEYDPADIVKLVKPLIAGRAEIVYGVRRRGHDNLQPTLIHAVGNSVMTWTANLLYGTAISDLHTCLKMIPVELFRSFSLTETGFGLDTEVTAELLRRGYRPFEVPISYVGRSKDEGKKIKFSDAISCFRVLIQVRLRGAVPPGKRDRSLLPDLADSVATNPGLGAAGGASA